MLKMQTAQAMDPAQVERNRSARIGIVANDRIDHGPDHDHIAARKNGNVPINDRIVQVVAAMPAVANRANHVSIVAAIDHRPMIGPADPATVATNVTNMHGIRVVVAIAIDGHDLGRVISMHRVDGINARCFRQFRIVFVCLFFPPMIHCNIYDHTTITITISYSISSFFFV